MRRLRDLSIRQKLTLIVMVPSMMALLLASVLFVTYDYVSFRQSMVDARLSDAEMIGANCEAALTFFDAGDAEETLSALHIHAQIVSASIFDADDQIFAQYRRAGSTGEPVPIAPQPAGAFFTDVYLFIYQPIMSQGEKIGTIAIQSDLSEVQSRMRGYVSTVVPAIAICLCVTFLLQAWLGRFLTRPISQLAKTAKAVSEKQDYSLRAQKYGEDELGSLTDRFNEMLSQIQRQNDALSEGEARFRNVLDNTQDVLYKLNLETMRYEYFSPSVVEVTGFGPRELLHLGDAGMRGRIHPDDRESVKTQLERATEERSTHAEYRWKNKAGDYIWISENQTTVQNEEGQMVAIVGSLRDVTERKLAAEEVLRMRHHLQSIIDSMPSVLIGVDIEGVVTHWNQEAERASGLSTEEAVGRVFSDVFPLLADKADAIRDAIAQQTPLLTEQFSIVSEEGKTIFYDVIVYALVGRDVTGAVIRVDDVSERVQIEEMMVQTEKMMSVGGLAAGMAHEINNPLGGILQACQNIVRRTSPDLPKNRQVAEELGIDIDHVHTYFKERGILEFIEGVRSDGARAAKIVADMLAFSRRSDSKFEEVNVGEMLDTVLRLAANDYNLRKHYDFRRIKIVRDFDPELPVVHCDKTKIEQVLLNLVKNAAQAMGANEAQVDPTLTILTRKDPKYARIEVIDNGPGMEEEVRRRVMEPFFTTKEVGIGTGLGLSVSYFIIAKHHRGTMNVESTPGEGTRFIICLPLDGKV